VLSAPQIRGFARAKKAGNTIATGRNREMTRNLKALGLALLVAFALSAVAASAASAQTQDVFTFEAGNNAGFITGTSHDNVFKRAERK
jgi:hypothetical protein